MLLKSCCTFLSFFVGQFLKVKPSTLQPKTPLAGDQVGPRCREFCVLSLWAFLSTALWRVSGNITLKDSREPVTWCGYWKTSSLAPQGSLEPELVEVGSRQREGREGTGSVGCLENGIPSNRAHYISNLSLGKTGSNKVSKMDQYHKARL